MVFFLKYLTLFSTENSLQHKKSETIFYFKKFLLSDY